MSPQEVARRFFEELWNGQDLEVADQLIAPNCVTHQLRSAVGSIPSAPRGPEALKEHIRGWLTAFPDLRWEIEASIEQGDRVVTWVTARGTHQGTWQGVPPTGRKVVVRGVVMHRVVAGQIAEDWVLTEALGLYQQLNLVPATATLLQQAGSAG